MSENSLPEQRTEMPTERRMGQLRRDGGLFHSRELEQTISLVAGFFMVRFMAPTLFGHMQYVFKKAFTLIGTIGTDPLTSHSLYTGFLALLLLVGPDIVSIVGVIAVLSALAVMLQTKWNVREKKIKVDFKVMNPITGIKRVLSVNGLMNIGKSLVKLAIILPIGFFALKHFAPQMVQLMHMQLDQIFAFTAAALKYMFLKIVYVLIAIALFDYFYGHHRWLRQNKMTKVEVKDDRKAVEGDEETKRAIQRKGMQRIMQRIRETVPTADVIVTNPTHYAVALKYDRGQMSAPKVVAKGRNHLALRIREIARENGIPILERKPLARALYGSVEVGATIPRDMFKAVAEVLAYVYKLKNPRYRPQQRKKG